MRYELRAEYQTPCVEGVREAYRQKFKVPLLVAPTGAGKTVIFSYIAEEASSKGKRVLIMAHRKELCTQCGEKMIANGVDFGYINPGFTPDYRKPIQVGTIQSIVARMGKMEVGSRRSEVGSKEVKTLYIPDLIIIDEAHRSIAPTYLKIIAFYRKLNPNLLLLGVTASPVRSDGKGLDLLYDVLVPGPTVRQLIELGYLVDPQVYGAEVHADLSTVAQSSDGDHNQVQLSAAVNTPAITGDAVAHYAKICPGSPAIVFCVDVKHAVDVAAKFRAAGYLFEHVDGKMSDVERQGIFTRLRSGAIHGITSVNLITEGFDAPMVRCVIALRPTLSLALAIQMPGRGMRPYPGKKVMYFLDHANISSTLAQGENTIGFIDDDRTWTLQGEEPGGKSKRKKGDKEGRLTQCPHCYRQHHPAPVCPACGFKYEVNSRIIQVQDGELVALKSPAQLAREMMDRDINQLAAIGGDDWAAGIAREWEERSEEVHSR